MKRKSPALALGISLAVPIIWFTIVEQLAISFSLAYVVEDESGILDLFLLILLVVDGFGQFYNGEYRKGVKFLACSGLRARAFHDAHWGVDFNAGTSVLEPRA